MGSARRTPQQVAALNGCFPRLLGRHRYHQGCLYGATSLVEAWIFAVITQTTIGGRASCRACCAHGGRAWPPVAAGVQNRHGARHRPTPLLAPPCTPRRVREHWAAAVLGGQLDDCHPNHLGPAAQCGGHGGGVCEDQPPKAAREVRGARGVCERALQASAGDSWGQRLLAASEWHPGLPTIILAAAKWQARLASGIQQHAAVLSVAGATLPGAGLSTSRRWPSSRAGTACSNSCSASLTCGRRRWGGQWVGVQARSKPVGATGGPSLLACGSPRAWPPPAVLCCAVQVVQPSVRAYLYTWGEGRVTVEGEHIPGGRVCRGGVGWGGGSGAMCMTSSCSAACSQPLPAAGPAQHPLPGPTAHCC